MSTTTTNTTIIAEVDQGDYVSSLSTTQEKILALLPILPSLLSAWGSFQIIWMVLASPKSSAYRRILLGMSCSDFISSLTLIWQPFLVPAETSQSVWAIGNDTTCNAMGWFVQFAFCSVWYNMMLSIYFLLLVRFKVKDKDFQRKYECGLHCICVGFPLVTATTGAIIGLYRELQVGDGCWITGYPEGCFDCTELADDQVLPDGMVCCISSRFGWSFGGVPTMLSFVIIVTNYLITYCHVQRTVSLHDTVMSSRSPTRDPYLRRIRAVLSQCFLYVLAFLICYLPAFALRVMESLTFDPEDEDKLFPMLVVQAITLPLQGLINCLIYVRPTYLRARQDFPNESKYWAFRRALHGDRIQPTDDHRASSLYDAPAFSHVVLSPSQNKPSELATGLSSIHNNDTSTGVVSTTANDMSWSLSSRPRHHNHGDPSQGETPPIMPRRVKTRTCTQSAMDVEYYEPDYDFEENDEDEDCEGRGPLKGGFLSFRWRTQRNPDNPPTSNPPPDSNFVSSLAGSEFDFVDTTPALPDRVESQIEGLPPIPSKFNEFLTSERHDDKLPVAPLRDGRISSVVEEEGEDGEQHLQPPNRTMVTNPQPAAKGVLPVDDGEEVPSKTHTPSEGTCPKKGGFLLTLKQKSNPQPNDSQFVSSLVGSEFDYIDEAPALPDRVESKAEVLPSPMLSSKAKEYNNSPMDKSPLAPTRERSAVEAQSADAAEKGLNTQTAAEALENNLPPGRRNPLKGFLLSLIKRKNHQPNDSQFVSSLAGSEFDFIDEAPEPPARVGSQAEGLPQDTDQALSSAWLMTDDIAAVLPARERSSADKQPLERTIQVDAQPGPSKRQPPGRNSLKASVLSLFQKRYPQPEENEFVSSSLAGSGCELVDEAPEKPARLESHGESLPQPNLHAKANQSASSPNGPPVAPARVHSGTDLETTVPRRQGTPTDEFNDETSSNSRVKNGFLLRLKPKQNPQPNDSQYVSSLAGSEFDCIDEAPEPPARVESEVEDPTPQERPCASLEPTKNYRSPTAPAVGSSRAEKPPSVPRRWDTETDDSIDDEKDPSNPGKCP